MIQLVDCPRDALQGWQTWIPTEKKVAYYNLLLKVGFDTLDCVSFVSPKAVPQMKDSAEVVQKLDVGNTKTKLLAIVVNERGAKDAVQWETIHFLGYPFSISETFQLRNTKKTIAQSWDILLRIQDLCVKHNKTLLVYLSMGFGNPYGDPWDESILLHWAEKMYGIEVRYVMLADTAGDAKTESIALAFRYLTKHYPQVIWGAHFHAQPQQWKEKILTALENGCQRFDGAIQGYGGCPFAKEELVGNVPTEGIYQVLKEKGKAPALNEAALQQAITYARKEIFV